MMYICMYVCVRNVDHTQWVSGSATQVLLVTRTAGGITSGNTSRERLVSMNITQFQLPCIFSCNPEFRTAQCTGTTYSHLAGLTVICTNAGLMTTGKQGWEIPQYLTIYCSQSFVFSLHFYSITKTYGSTCSHTKIRNLKLRTFIHLCLKNNDNP